MSTQEERMKSIRTKAVEAWCTKETEKRTMDPVLCQAFADILEKELYKPNLGCATTRELLEEITARIEIDGNLDYKTIQED